ncbi:MAG: hypothetical protein H6577_18810 [Lewinellaceae bacterium]|nr:hypothetical protein [Saprospiraceae bacterium]MCB9340177.1 hypothetical protein [Lewinellaceae bacterium]
MQYEIKIKSPASTGGSISLERLALLATSLQSIAKGALQIRLGGMSNWRGRSTLRLNNALEIRLRGIREGGTILDLECDSFKETLAGQQGDVFRPQILENLPALTPMALVIQSFHDALAEDGQEEHLDKALLHDLQNFKRVFLAPDETISFSNRGSLPALKLNKKVLNKIKTLEEQTPDPQSVIVKGLVETLKYSNSKVTIQMEEGRVDAFLPDTIKPVTIGKHWGKELTIAGIANYRPSGRIAYIQIEKIFQPGKGDDYFSRKKSSESTEHQIKRQHSEQQFQNNLGEIIGQWPGEESFQDLLKLLNA